MVYRSKIPKIHFATWRNAFINVKNYILEIWTNFMLQFGQKICNLEKYIFQFEEIHFVIWTNTFRNFNLKRKLG